MKLLTLILLGVIVLHQTYLPVLNSLLWIELGLLALFYFVGGKYFKEYRLSQQRKKALKEWKGYTTPKEVKTWREYSSNTEVKVTREDLFDRL